MSEKNERSGSQEIVVAEIEGADKKKKLTQVTGRPSKRSLANAQLELNDNQLKLAVWLSVPERSRKPATRAELAKVLGVTEATLYRWQKIPEVIMAVRWLQLNHAGDVVRVANVLDFLYETTQNSELWMKDRLAAAKEWLKAVGVHEAWKYDNSLLKVKTVDDFDLDSLSDEELWDLYNTRASSVGLTSEATNSVVGELSNEEE